MSHHFKIMIDAGLLRVDVAGKVHLNNLRLEDLESRFPGLMPAVLREADRMDEKPLAARKNGRRKPAEDQGVKTS